jgi:hypothetical protein
MVKAMGGVLKIEAEFPRHGRVQIKQFEKLRKTG